MSRAELLAMGRAGRPWAFLPLAAQAIDQQPDDHDLRIALAANFAAVGLRTPAIEHLCALPPQIAASGEGSGLARQIHALPDDTLQPGRLTRAVRAALEPLAARGVDLRDRVGAWRERIESEQWLRAAAGAVVRRDGLGRWLLLTDDPAEASAMPLPQLEPDGRPSPDRCEGPFVFDGLAGPWLLMRVHETTPVTTCGYQPRLIVIESGIDALFDAFAMADLRAVAADARVAWFVGEDAAGRFEDFCRARSTSIIAGPVYTAQRPDTGAAGPIVEAHTQRQRDEAAQMQRRLKERSAVRDVAWWRRRYEDALAGGEPLRVLIQTTVHSTFLRHSARDLAERLREIGCTAEVLVEDDTHSRMAGIAYLSAVDRLDPDLVVSLNITRRQMHGFVPANVPFVCWIQDRMVRLFDPAEGEAQTDLDFLMGHMFGELFARCGYPRERAWAQPVPVSAAKFSSEPAPADLVERFACDVAYVSHQSDPPETMLERFCAACRDTPLMERFLREIFPLLERAADAPGDTPFWKRWEDAGSSLLHADERLFAVRMPAVWGEFCGPLVERMLRMRTLEWAADICRRRGWRMRLFGRGWDRHPTLHEFAAGPLDHGDEIRAAYQTARVHLHASTQTTSHQRVFECAMAGGLMLRRVAIGDLDVARQEIAREFAERTGPIDGETIRVREEDSELLRAHNDRRRALGFEPARTIELGRELMDAVLLRPPAPISQILDLDLAGAEATAFTTQPSLEAALDRAITDDAWRDAQRERIRGWVADRFTYAALADDLPRRILAGLRGRPVWETRPR
jgi:hypothetical protein